MDHPSRKWPSTCATNRASAWFNALIRPALNTFWRKPRPPRRGVIQVINNSQRSSCRLVSQKKNRQPPEMEEGRKNDESRDQIPRNFVASSSNHWVELAHE